MRNPLWLLSCVSLFTGLLDPLRDIVAAEPQRKVRFTCSAAVTDLPSGAREVSLWIPFPSSGAYQQVSNITVRSDVPTSVAAEPEYGNQVLFLKVPIDGGRRARVELSFDVTRTEHLHRAVLDAQPVDETPPQPVLPRRLLEPDRLAPIDGRIAELAREVTRGCQNDLERVKAIYDHTVSTLKYDKTGTGWGRGDIYHACDVKKGNCTDFHAVFIGLCRASRIPARFEIGFSLPTDRSSGQIAGYHCWAECYVAGHGWIPVDASEAQKNPARRDYFFGAHDQHRVAFSQGRDIRLAPPQRGEPLNFFIYPYAEVDGRPHEKIERSFAYEDLD